MDWRAGCADEFGVEAIAADDLNTYKPVVARLGLEHQICMAHPLKWALSRLAKIDGMEWFKGLIWRLLKKLPADGGLEILRLERLVRNAEDQSLRRPRVELSGKRRALLCHRRRGGRPVDEEHDGAGDRQEQDKVQDGQGIQERIGTVERVWADTAGLELSELVAA